MRPLYRAQPINVQYLFFGCHGRLALLLLGVTGFSRADRRGVIDGILAI
jgi:hypothetical protein